MILLSSQPAARHVVGLLLQTVIMEKYLPRHNLTFSVLSQLPPATWSEYAESAS